MKLPDGTVLMHGSAPYDPRKAHEYYMRNRKLHPRAKGTTYTVSQPNGVTRTLSPAEYAKQQAYAAQRVSAIKARLVFMTQKLHEKVAALHRSQQNANKPQTAADKHKAAQQAKKYRQAHRQQLKNKARAKGSGGHSKASSSSTQHTQSIAELKSNISKAKDSLHAAIATQRALASAKKNG